MPSAALELFAPLEKDVQRDVMALLRGCGCRVFNLSQGYRPGGARHGTTRQTRGLPDLYVFPPRGLAPFWCEIKRLGGTQSPEQMGFQSLCAEAGTGYIVGGVAEVVTHLRTLGILDG